MAQPWFLMNDINGEKHHNSVNMKEKKDPFLCQAYKKILLQALYFQDNALFRHITACFGIKYNKIIDKYKCSFFSQKIVFALILCLQNHLFIQYSKICFFNLKCQKHNITLKLSQNVNHLQIN